MQHREITAAVVAEIDHLLAEKQRPATIARRMGVSTYVVELIVHDSGRKRRSAPPESPGNSRRPHRANVVDVATVRRIQRMLAVGILRQTEIAREAGVSDNFVNEVARGVRTARDTSRPPLAADERFLCVPIRCSVCRRRISIVPCRACRAVREANRPSLSR